jgi:hypothetical protein
MKKLICATPISLTTTSLTKTSLIKKCLGQRFSTALISMGACVFFLSACASPPPPPTQEISAAEQSLTDAEQARVAQYALPELQEARSKLAAARKAVQDEQMVKAKRLALEASASIKLASAKADLAKAEEVNAQMKKNIQVLEEEMQRTQGVQQ